MHRYVLFLCHTVKRWSRWHRNEHGYNMQKKYRCVLQSATMWHARTCAHQAMEHWTRADGAVDTTSNTGDLDHYRLWKLGVLLLKLFRRSRGNTRTHGWHWKMITHSLMNATRRTLCKENKISRIRRFRCIGNIQNSQPLEADPGLL